MSELENKAKQLTDEELEKVTGGQRGAFKPYVLADESDEEKGESKVRPMQTPPP